MKDIIIFIIKWNIKLWRHINAVLCNSLKHYKSYGYENKMSHARVLSQNTANPEYSMRCLV